MSVEPRIAVLMGGESEEREISLLSGQNILEALGRAGIRAEGYDWHPRRMSDFLAQGFDRVFVALHGGSGENGMVQAMLEMAGIPFTGVRMQTAAMCMDKTVSKALVSRSSVSVPSCRTLTVMQLDELRAGGRLESELDKIVSEIGIPLVVKPARNGSSVGVSIVESRSDLSDAVRAASLSQDETVLFEQYICGHELTVAILNGKALGVCRIIPKTKFYDYEAKYNRDDTEYLVPSGLGDDFDGVLCRQAEEVARVLNCTSGVVRIDFLADRELHPYFLEVNTVPGMTSHSLVPKIAAHAGYDFPELCRMVLEMAK